MNPNNRRLTLADAIGMAIDGLPEGGEIEMVVSKRTGLVKGARSNLQAPEEPPKAPLPEICRPDAPASERTIEIPTEEV